MQRAPAISALARQTMRVAFEELNRTISPGDSRAFGQIALQDVKKAALDIENQLAARQSLRYMRRLMPLFNGLEHYSKVVDILCNGTPFLPWIWAPITLILRIASEYVEAFEQIKKAYASIASSLGRFERLSAALATDSNFQQTLAVFYTSILQFHKHAYKFVHRNSWKLLFLTTWGRFQRRFENILEDLKRHGQLIDTEANAYNISEEQKMRQDLRSWQKRVSPRSWLNLNESDQLIIFSSVSTQGSEYPGTCEWVLQNPKVRSWCQRKPDTAILWLQGAPGSGKSVLSSQLINFMKAAKSFVIHHFCNSLYATSTTYEHILKSMLVQLLRKDDDLVAYVYQECVVVHLVIIDGLDECEPKTQTTLTNLINQITKSSIPGGITCKVLVSSRISSIALGRLRKRQVISLTEEKDSMRSAIRQYICHRLQVLHERFSQLGIEQSELDEIQDMIINKTDGMFLYARLILDYLSRNIFYNYDEIKTSMNQLPEELADFYRNILTEMLSLLGWVAFAKRPLRQLEFLSALSYSSGNPDVTNLAPQYLMDIFLQTPSSNVIIHEQEAIQEHGLASIASLISGTWVFNEKYPEESKHRRVARGLHGLHVYATEYWTEYVLSHAESSGGFHQASRLSRLALQLVDELDKTHGISIFGNTRTSDKVSDERLALLQEHDSLHRCVDEALKIRSLKRLEFEILQVSSADKPSQESLNSASTEPISAMLVSYQKIVRVLLNQDTCPGVTTKELDSFKSHFRISAFTCRLKSCCRGSMGFESEKECLDHEKSHIRSLQ
ncbi:hypothetical protein EDB81DRAFT_908734 [Dactylonectria macrodidyma]|uniref:NACHT domain-containing protein n=1 Tax=Dactylonectria macrodidyma TaxID=307937 RepID=A0A9P9FPE1_9HYPO|nr:hypothetical protein EDB81DRAFT_908734 [Dactylonectria macrodidyma]